MNDFTDEDDGLDQGRSLKKKTEDAGCFFGALFIFVIILFFGWIGNQWF